MLHVATIVSIRFVLHSGFFQMLSSMFLAKEQVWFSWRVRLPEATSVSRANVCADVDLQYTFVSVIVLLESQKVDARPSCRG
jgi:hypothetical protein